MCTKSALYRTRRLMAPASSSSKESTLSTNESRDSQRGGCASVSQRSPISHPPP
jgi:hypothetical protein